MITFLSKMITFVSIYRLKIAAATHKLHTAKLHGRTVALDAITSRSRSRRPLARADQRLLPTSSLKPLAGARTPISQQNANAAKEAVARATRQAAKNLWEILRLRSQVMPRGW
jgi:hypothetical protein